jgi:hydroxymethylglutaryl-CoA reductase
MRLHARSVAAAANVSEDLFEEVVAGMIDSGDIKTWKAEELAAASSPPDDARKEPLRNSATGEASGKVILLGEHAVVYDRHALALPLPGAVRVEIAERDSGINLEVPDWDISDDWVAGGKVPDGAAAVITLIMQELKVDDRGFDIRVNSKIPIGVGLGSSAAFAVAAIRAFCALLGVTRTDIEVDRLAFRCERLTHGNPSGVDNNLATFGEPVLYSRTAGTRTRPLQLAEPPPIVVASSSVRGSTLEMVEGVSKRFKMNETLYTTIFDEIDEMSIAGATALRERDYQLLGALMNVCHGYLNAIEVSTPELEAMVAIAREAGAVGAKLTGAGGGGSIVALCPGKVDAVADALGQAGYSVYRIQ